MDGNIMTVWIFILISKPSLFLHPEWYQVCVLYVLWYNHGYFKVPGSIYQVNIQHADLEKHPALLFYSST